MVLPHHSDPPPTLWKSASPKQRFQVLAYATIGIAIVGWIDYASGVELRIYPLYFVPIGYAAWHLGRAGGTPTALGSALAWMWANGFGGLEFSDPGLWFANTLMQALSFLVVSSLVGLLRERLLIESTRAGVDSLTALLNRRAFFDAGARVVMRCRRVGSPATLAYLDLDFFKQVNDSQGHATGDQVLRDAAELIKMAVRPADLVARIGGDEFAILLAEANVEGATVAVERVRVGLERAFAEHSVKVTASIGVAWYASPPDQLDPMMREADAALYVAKGGGRNQVHLVRVDTA